MRRGSATTTTAATSTPARSTGPRPRSWSVSSPRSSRCWSVAFVGVIAGFFGGWVDAILSRVTDIFFAIPLLLGGMLVLTSFPSGEDTNLCSEVGKVVLALGILGWTSMTRIMRSSVIQVAQADFVAGGAGAGCQQQPDHPQARRAQLAGAADRGGDDLPRRVTSAPRPRCRSWASVCSRRSSPGAP